MPDSPGPPLNYQRIEDELRRTMARLESLTGQFAGAVDAKAVTEADYKVGIAVARLDFRHERTGEKVTDAMTADHATRETADLYRAWLLAEANYESLKQAIYSARDRGDHLRSLMASYRTVDGG